MKEMTDEEIVCYLWISWISDAELSLGDLIDDTRVELDLDASRVEHCVGKMILSGIRFQR